MLSIPRWQYPSLAVFFVLVATACTHAAQSAPSPDRNVITFAEIESAQEGSAYDVIARYRSNFLNSRGKNSILLKVPSEATVYLDETEYGAINSLRNIPASHVAEIRFIGGWDAMSKYGSGHAGGVIQVITRRQ